MRWKHNPPCESLLAELLHGVIERSAGVFADRGASLNYYPIAYHSGDFCLKLDRAVLKNYRMMCAPFVGRKKITFLQSKFATNELCATSDQKPITMFPRLVGIS